MTGTRRHPRAVRSCDPPRRVDPGRVDESGHCAIRRRPTIRGCATVWGRPRRPRGAIVSSEASPIHPLLAAARAALPDVVEVRRRLHRRPEIGLRLPGTQAMVIEALRAIGLERRPGEHDELGGGGHRRRAPGPDDPAAGRHGRRCRSARTPASSSRPRRDGAMHGCGHDTHVAMLLGAARLLVERRDELAGPRPADVPARRGGLPRRPVHDRGGPARGRPARRRTRGRRVRDPHRHRATRRTRSPCGRARCSPPRTRSARRSAAAAVTPRAAAPRARPDPDRRRARPRAPGGGDPRRGRLRPGGPDDRPDQRRHDQQRHPRDASRSRGRSGPCRRRPRELMRELVARVARGRRRGPRHSTVELEIVPGLPGHDVRPGRHGAGSRGLAADLAGRGASSTSRSRSWAPRTSPTSPSGCPG